MGSSSPNRGENKTYLKQTTTQITNILREGGRHEQLRDCSHDATVEGLPIQ